jgi:CubicO group peptidase (beta-lactamase class C family)
MTMQGFAAPGFERVRDAFAHNFIRDDEYGELGASLAVYQGGALVVDLADGWADAAKTKPWTPDTLVNVWSATKGVTAIEVAALVYQGKLKYDARVADYWPEYAQHGKADTTVSHVLSHQAGLPGFAEPTPLNEFYKWEIVTERLARQEPLWPPGTKNSYHAMTYGFLAGELVRRASGKRVGQFLAEDVAGPLGADVFIGLPEKEEPRVSPLIPSRIQRDFDLAAAPREAVMAVTNPNMAPTLPNDRAWRAAEIPAGNGHASARGLAKLYGALANGGTLNGVTLMDDKTIAALAALQTDRVDVLLGAPAMWRNGMSGNVANMYGGDDDTIGHSGWGGSFGCFNRRKNVGIGYVLNQMGDKTIGDPRCTELCAAIFASVK